MAIPAGEGVYRITASLIWRVRVPMVTALFIDNQWIPFIDGEQMSKQFASGCPRLSLHRCVANYLHRNNSNPSFDVVIGGEAK
jgi:hypothetical protein